VLRLLVVANRTCPCPDLLDQLVQRTRDHADHEVLVVAPALNSRLRHYVSDVDGAVAAAGDRLAHAVKYLTDTGVAARGEIGDSDPLVAIGDALAGFAADEIVIATLPEGHSNWLERNLIERARRAYGLPLTHVVSHRLPTPRTRHAAPRARRRTARRAAGVR
jgi:hypothetical protein